MHFSHSPPTLAGFGKRPLWVADSTGRCNTFRKALRRGVKAKGFPGSLVELVGHLVNRLQVHHHHRIVEDVRFLGDVN